MSAPFVIDSAAFARARRRISGSLPTAGLVRLDDLLADRAGDLDYRVEGASDNHGRLQLVLHVSGLLHLQCQRCLDPMDYRLEIENTLILLPAGAAEADGDDDPDAPESVEASKELNITSLIEDEILLGLPPYPRHADGVCQPAGAMGGAGYGAKGKLAGLAALKNLGKSFKE